MSLAGKIVRFVWFSFDNCVSTSKVRIPSTSSPKNSIRKGSNWDISKISKISPRILNSPCVCTWVTFRYPISFNRWSSSCWSYSSPTAIFIVLSLNLVGEGKINLLAAILQTKIPFLDGSLKKRKASTREMIFSCEDIKNSTIGESSTKNG